MLTAITSAFAPRNAGDPGPAAAGRASHAREAVLPQIDTPLEEATRGTRWMSARSPQPDAVSFSGTDARSTGIPERSSVESLLWNPGAADEASGDTAAMRHAMSAYAANDGEDQL